MSQSTTTHAEPAGTKTTHFNICAAWNGSRFDLPEGREWLVTTNDNPAEKPHRYLVAVWVESELGRVASCQCRAFQFGNPCRHIKYVALVDSILTGAPTREIKPVYS